MDPLKIADQPLPLVPVSSDEELVKTRLHRARAILRDELCRRAGDEIGRAFSFHLSRCDRVVTAVMARIHARAEADLYYRLNVFAIRLPPLRERRDDILPLTEAFVTEIGRTLGRPPGGVSREARETLLEYHWPGNVRELRNVLERAAILADGGLIAAEHLSLRGPGAVDAASRRTAAPAAPAPKIEPLAGDLKSVERSMIERALNDARFNKSVAARKLGLSRAQLYVRLRRHGLE